MDLFFLLTKAFFLITDLTELNANFLRIWEPISIFVRLKKQFNTQGFLEDSLTEKQNSESHNKGEWL